MIKTTKTNGITINNYFTSKTDEEMASNMSKIVARLINRELENFKKEKNARETIAI